MVNRLGVTELSFKRTSLADDKR